MEPTDDTRGVGRRLICGGEFVVGGREENVLCSSRRSKWGIPGYETTSNY